MILVWHRSSNANTIAQRREDENAGKTLTEKHEKISEVATQVLLIELLTLTLILNTVLLLTTMLRRMRDNRSPCFLQFSMY